MQPTSGVSALEGVLAHRRWVRRSLPFPHVVATDVFTDEVYGALATDFERLLHDGAISRPSGSGYGATWARLTEHTDGPLGLFASREWHDLVAGVVGVESTGDVSVGLHHHEPGGAAGWPHNDLNPGWFADPAPQPHEVRLEDAGVDYHHGPADQTPARETVRAVSVLFYLANPEWSEGDGGETGLYADVAAGARGEGLLVPPLNNSLVLFECTPFSWHGDAGASRHPRNCVVMWTHRPQQDVVQRWGESSVVHW
ncbi:hypothetical protein BH11ACT8_BH11ACT8_13840 [soil metagenome]